jgi:PAS domain S-box-containing protein
MQNIPSISGIFSYSFPLHDIKNTVFAIISANGNILSVSQNWESFIADSGLGTEEYAEGTKYQNIFQAASFQNPADIIQGITSVIEGNMESFYIETTCCSPDGKKYYVLLVNPLAKGYPAGVLLRCMDITGYKMKEASLKDSESHLRETLDHMDKAIAVYEAVDGGNDFIVVDMNRLGETFTHYRIEDVVGKRVSELFPGEASVGLIEKLKETWQTDEPSHIPLKQYKDERITLWVENYIFKLPSGKVVTMFEDTLEKRRAEQALRESENKYSTLVEKGNDGIVIMQDGLFKYANKKLVELAGFSEDVIGKPFIDFVLPEYREKVAEYLKKRLSGEDVPSNYEIAIVSAKSDPIPAEISASLIEYDNRPAVMAIVRDISKRKKNENRIKYLSHVLGSIRNVNQLIVKEKNKEQLLQGICDNFVQTQGYESSWICLLDENNRIILARESGIGDLFESSELKQGILPHCARRILAGDVNLLFIDKLYDCNGCYLAGGCDDSIAIVSRLKYGDKLYGIIANSIPVEYSKDKEALSLFEEVVGDISFALHNLELETLHRKSEALLDTIVSTIPELVWLKDENGVFITCNARLERLYGFKKEDIVGKTDYDFVDKKLADYFIAKDKTAMDAGKPVINEEEVTYADDGHKEILETIKTPIYNSEGSLIGVLGIGRDITNRKKIEQALLESKIAAEDANRTKSEFLANMSHELRTPLNSIIGFSQVLADRKFGDLNEKQMKYVANVLKSGRHLLEVINSVLDLSKIESGTMEYEPETIKLSETIEELLLLMEPLAKKKFIELTATIEPGGLDISVDRIKFKEIIYNLLGNAIKFTPEKGKINIRSEIVDTSLHITVSDTGIGISKENLGTIFEPFKQTDPFLTRQYGGTGLGLAIVKKYVKMHGGKIWVTSEAGVGSSFTFTIPLVCNF